MSNNDHDAHKQSSTHRSRHQITRSITELSGPMRLHRHHHPHHHSQHLPDRDVPSSAAPIPHGRASLDGVRSEGATPNMSPGASRRPSIRSSDDVAIPPALWGQPVKHISKEEELNAERDRVAAITTGLKRSLVDLGTYSTAATRQLDLTCSSVLEKLGTLQGNVLALKELAGMSREMSDNFSKETGDFVRDVQSQMDAFGNFGDQQRRIQTLEERIDGGRQKITALGERVDIVRERIEAWERADRDWQERTRRRLKIIWWIMSIIVFLFLLLFISAQYVPDGLEAATVRLANETISKLRNGTLLSDGSPGPVDASARLHRLLNGTGRTATASDELLQVFDEL